MPTKANLKSALGGLNPFKQSKALPKETKKHDPTTSKLDQTADITIKQNPELPRTTTTMSREELKARRMARVENASGLVEHFHIRLMLRYLDVLVVVVPFSIIYFTTSELGQLFTGKPFNIGDQTSQNMYGASLLAELVYAGITFIWQYSNAYATTIEDAAERELMKKFSRGVMWTWSVFSAISALGQYKYLSTMYHPASADFFTYALIVARVTIFIGSDYACAKYLGWRVTTLRKIAQEEKARGEAYAELEANEAKRMEKEAEADAHMRQIEINIRSAERSAKTTQDAAERTAKITNDVQELMGQSAVKFLGQFMGSLDSVMNNVLQNVNEQLNLPPAQEGKFKELDEPKTGDL